MEPKGMFCDYCQEEIRYGAEHFCGCGNAVLHSGCPCPECCDEPEFFEEETDDDYDGEW